MDTDPKSRGLKHAKNKKKYNKHKPPGHVQMPQKSKSSILESNWSRYESDVDENEDNRNENVTKLDSRTDFSILANLPISQGSHFQFKTQTLIEDESLIKTHDLFKLDLNLLNSSIATIPFHKRCNIDYSYFTKDEQEALIKTAVKNEIIYKDYLNKNNTKITNPIFDHLECSEDESDGSTRDEGHEFISQVLNNDSANSNGNINDNTDNNNYNDDKELVTLQNNQIKNDTNDENLEEWLDDILDD